MRCFKVKDIFVNKKIPRFRLIVFENDIYENVDRGKEIHTNYLWEGNARCDIPNYILEKDIVRIEVNTNNSNEHDTELWICVGEKYIN